MPQILMLPGGHRIDVDQSFTDGGQPAEYAMIGGRRTLLTEGHPARPMIHRRGESFFYADGKPVDRAEDVEWIPEPWRSKALAFLEKKGEGKAKAKAVETPTKIRPQRRPKPRRIMFRAADALGERLANAPAKPGEPDLPTT